MELIKNKTKQSHKHR